MRWRTAYPRTPNPSVYRILQRCVYCEGATPCRQSRLLRIRADCDFASDSSSTACSRRVRRAPRALVVRTVQIGREYNALYPLSFGGLSLTARVNNTLAARSAWQDFATARHGRPVFIVAPDPDPGPPDANDTEIWVVQDALPVGGISEYFIGISYTAYDLPRQTVRALHGLTAANLTSSEVVSVSGLLRLPGIPIPFAISFATVYDDDPSELLVAAPTAFNDFLVEVNDQSEHALFLLRDHVGRQLVGTSTCTFDQVQQNITAPVTLSSNVEWTITIGQCPKYAEAYVTWRRYGFLAICLVCTWLAVGCIVLGFVVFDKQAKSAEERLLSQQKENANLAIVGYVCHELRNPLHVVKAAVRVAVEELSNRFRASPAGTSGFDLTSTTLASQADPQRDKDDLVRVLLGLGDATDTYTRDEVLNAVGDLQSAIQQMQTTVNDVLDFRAMQTGLNSLRLKKTVINIEDVSTALALLPYRGVGHPVHCMFCLRDVSRSSCQC